jgi:putative effector of murein hydrolase
MGGGVKLQDYADVKSVASNGKLLGTVSHASGFSPMPKGGNKLNDCYVAVIKKWIAAGALNN